jgi:1,4-dihydroxy-6-naphthoate synthase
MVVAREPLTLDDLRRTEIVIPGRLTTAYLGLRLALGTDDLAVRELPFDQVLPEVVEGRAAAGLIIHEGQLTYEEHGLVKVLDTGEWWQAETGLPLPLSLVAVRRDVDRAGDVSAVLREAIRTGLEHRDEAMRYAMGFGRGIDAETADEFVGMYVNDLTQDMGDRGKAAVAEVLRRVGSPVQPEFVD